jgi:hypothetical protein
MKIEINLTTIACYKVHSLNGFGDSLEVIWKRHSRKPNVDRQWAYTGVEATIFF